MPSHEVLYIEDNAGDFHLLERFLELEPVGCHLTWAPDGDEAMKILSARVRDCVALPLFVLLDLNLRKQDGVDVLRTLRADDQFAQMPVVVFTSSRAKPDVVRSYRAGANGFLIKRMDMAETVNSMKRLVDYWDAMARDLVVV